jgi:hypothetical protein
MAGSQGRWHVEAADRSEPWDRPDETIAADRRLQSDWAAIHCELKRYELVSGRDKERRRR